MKSGIIVTKRFKYRIKPHEALKNEYPSRYYKFYTLKVAKAFFNESLGSEIKIKQL